MDYAFNVWMPFGIKPLIVTVWQLYGMFGAFLFASRWIVQMYYSRKEGRPVTPRAFWVMSMIGSLITLTYFIASKEPVGIAGNVFPSFIAGYNLYLEFTHGRKSAVASATPPPPAEAAAKPAPSSEPAIANV